ncbi:hypothetical protein DSM03_10210 [Leeuwenhoekiella aestuarii]|nr:hypothetical protein DSM03_10210 [Leeuwenhoekiella aestuarii]
MARLRVSMKPISSNFLNQDDDSYEDKNILFPRPYNLL